MQYRALPPPYDLTPWVECLWFLDGCLAPEGQTILPDGRRELLFHFGGLPSGRWGVQPRTLVSESSAEAIDLRGQEPMSVMGIRLHPEAADVTPSDSWSSRVLEQCGNAPPQSRPAMVWTHLRTLLADRKQPDSLIAESVRRIERSHGCGPLMYHIPDGLGERQWQRRFRAACGFSPKTFARIARLQRLIRLCESGSERGFADLALAAGYFDQSHLTNDFRSFCGRSPEAFFRSGRGMSEFYRDGFFQDADQSSMSGLEA